MQSLPVLSDMQLLQGGPLLDNSVGEAGAQGAEDEGAWRGSFEPSQESHSMSSQDNFGGMVLYIVRMVPGTHVRRPR